MANDELALYRRWLACGLEKEKCHDKQYVQDSFAENIQSTPAYQIDATVNGESQPIVATRKGTKKCKVTVIPGTKLHIGDLVYVFSEYWICVELYIDEYGMWYGELWMCNQIFCYQDHDLNIIHKYAILDDGSYSDGKDKAIKVTDNSFTCYISLDDESKALYVDKRLAISVIYDAKGKEILEVGQIKWIDIKSRNFGEGSHLMLFGVNDDAFNPEKDNIEELICDYIEPLEIPEEPIEPVEPVEPDPDDSGEKLPPDETEEEPAEPVKIGNLSIEGRATIRIGSGRTYTVKATSYEDGSAVEVPNDIAWSIEADESKINIAADTATTCKVTIPEDYNLIGFTFKIKCSSVGGEYDEAEFNVEVI